MPTPPDLKVQEYRGLLIHADIEDYSYVDDWIATGKPSKSLEYVINHIHISDEFLGVDKEVTEQMEIDLARKTRTLWDRIASGHSPAIKVIYSEDDPQGPIISFVRASSATTVKQQSE